MKKNKLKFEELSTDLEVLDHDNLRGIKGGLSAAELLLDILANGIGNHAGRIYTFDNGQNGYLSNTIDGGWLPEVVVTAVPLNFGSGGEKCGNCLDYSTIGNNLLGLSYPGGNNPLTIDQKYSYSYVPTNLSEYPAIGHDRRYDNLKISGALGLFSDTRAIGADWQFVIEELCIAANTNININDRLSALVLGVGLGLSVLPKTLFQISIPNGINQQEFWYKISNKDVNNAPIVHEH